MVRMLRTVQGSPDGINSYRYEKGTVYGPDTVPRTSPRLEEIFVKSGLGEPAQEEKVEQPGPTAGFPPDPEREKKVVEPREEAKDEEPSEDDEDDDEPFPRIDLNGYTINAVLNAVEEGHISAEYALAHERANRGRKRLIAELEAQVEE